MTERGLACTLWCMLLGTVMMQRPESSTENIALVLHPLSDFVG